MRKRLLTLIVCLVASPALGAGRGFHMTFDQYSDVVSIAKGIQRVNPRLEETKYLEYAYGIYRASKRYAIEPIILISIAQTESNFRENLPEGAAGEIGICQIRKMWLKNPLFVKEFKTQTIKDLNRPLKSFLFAAWILRELRRDSRDKGTLPYWSFYNSVKFENRLRYYVTVSRSISSLKKSDVLASLAIESEPMPVKRTAKSVVKAPATAVVAAQVGPQNNRWIPDALLRLQKIQEAQNQQNDNAWEKTVAKNGRRLTHPSLVRAAQELEIGSLYNPSVIE